MKDKNKKSKKIQQLPWILNNYLIIEEWLKFHLLQIKGTITLHSLFNTNKVIDVCQN